MILYDKLKKKYTRAELIKLLGDGAAGRVWRDEKNLRPHKISSKINILNLDYSQEDFLKDYNHLYKNHIEKEMLYSLFIKGVSLNELKKSKNLESMIYSFLKHGFDYNSTSRNLHLIFDELGINVDISMFKIDVYFTHIELFADKESLDNFKSKYQIKYDLHWEPYRKSWHLAFNGCLATFIKKKHF